MSCRRAAHRRLAFHGRLQCQRVDADTAHPAERRQALAPQVGPADPGRRLVPSWNSSSSRLARHWIGRPGNPGSPIDTLSRSHGRNAVPPVPVACHPHKLASPRGRRTDESGGCLRDSVQRARQRCAAESGAASGRRAPATAPQAGESPRRGSRQCVGNCSIARASAGLAMSRPALRAQCTSASISSPLPRARTPPGR